MWLVIRGLIGDDEEGTLNRLRSIRADVIDPKTGELEGASSKPPEACWSARNCNGRG
jgi:hypothetical protein